MINCKKSVIGACFLIAFAHGPAQEFPAITPGKEEPISLQLKGGWPPQNLSTKAHIRVLDLSAQAPAPAPTEQKAPEPEAPKPVTTPPAAQPDIPPAPEQIPPPRLPKTPDIRSETPVGGLYTLGPGDTVVFSLFNRNDLKRTVKVAPDGTVSYLQAVAMDANGLTVDQLRLRMEEELKQYKRDVKVIVTPVAIESKQFAIIGRVKKPGSFVLDRPTTVLEGIAKAEGVEIGTMRGSAFGLADFEKSFVSRKGSKLDIDLARLYHEGDLSQNAFLQPDDYLYVASKLDNEFFVLGAVNRPGRVKILNQHTIASAIAMAGGFSDIAFRKKVLILRGNISCPEVEVVDVRNILKGSALDVPIRDRDIIFVPKRPFELLETATQNALFTYMQTVTAEAVNLNYTPFSL